MTIKKRNASYVPAGGVFDFKCLRSILISLQFLRNSVQQQIMDLKSVKNKNMYYRLTLGLKKNFNHNHWVMPASQCVKKI